MITAASPDHADKLYDLGASLVLDYHRASLWDVLPADSVHLVWDNYGADGTATLALPSLRAGGYYLSMAVGHFAPWQAGGSAASTINLPTLPPVSKPGVTASGLSQRSASIEEGLELMNTLMVDGKLKPIVGARFPLTDVPGAFAQSINGHTQGKIAIEVPRVEGWSPSSLAGFAA